MEYWRDGVAARLFINLRKKVGNGGLVERL